MPRNNYLKTLSRTPQNNVVLKQAAILDDLVARLKSWLTGHEVNNSYYPVNLAQCQK